MKSIATYTILLFALLTSGCKKPADQTNTWSFYSINYPVSACQAANINNQGIITGASSANMSQYGALQVNFYGALPTGTTTYTVINAGTALSAPGQAFISMQLNTSKNYFSTGGNGGQTISATVSNGKVSVSGSGITMVNGASPFDSSALKFQLTQTQ